MPTLKLPSFFLFFFYCDPLFFLIWLFLSKSKVISHQFGHKRTNSKRKKSLMKNKTVDYSKNHLCLVSFYFIFIFCNLDALKYISCLKIKEWSITLHFFKN
jgi:hypothetical protein